MFVWINRRLRQVRDGEGGWVLPAVLAISVVTFVVAASSASVAVGGMRKAATDQNWNGALAAAYAGVEEYQSRLANDSTYYKYGNPSAPFSLTSASLLSLPTETNDAFGIGAAGSWAKIPQTDPDLPSTASYRYEVDSSKYAISGILRLRSTGKVGDSTRTVIADLRQSGFIDFLYFTDYETLDPDVVAPGSGQACDRHVWDTPARTSGCTKIQFGGGDVINGPLHSNDRLVVCGAKFNGAVTTSNTLSPIWENACTSNPPTWAVNGGPTYDSAITMPPTNSEMAKETRVDLPDDVPRPGCMYTGPTQITFLGDGTMRVVSPLTKVTQPSYTSGVANKTPAACGKISELQSAAGSRISVLDSNLIFVQGMPGVGDPNYWATLPTGFCTNRSKSNEGWTYGTVSYPVANEMIPSTSSSTSPAYGCTNGDAYVKGAMKGAMTIAAQNYIYVTGDVTYVDDFSILGLVGQNAVWVYNPYGKVGSVNTSMLTDTNRTISAAILSVKHTFMVQNYDKGAYRGKLTIFGAIAQKFRGTVATTSTSGGTTTYNTGYKKDYNYDSRLRNTAPPKFLTPVSTTYGVTQFASVPPAFTAKGAAT